MTGRVKKIAFVGVVVATSLAVAALLLTSLFLNRIVAAAAHEAATYALQVDTVIKSAHVKPLSGKIGLKGLTVANPPGHDSDTFFRMGHAEANLGILSLLSDTVEIQRFALDDIEIWIEQDGGVSNCQTIAESLKRFESDDPADPGSAAPAPAAGTKGKKLLIRELEITNLTVYIDTPLMDAMEVPFARIYKENLSTDSNKQELAAQLASVVLQTVFSTIAANADNVLTDALTDALDGAMEGLGTPLLQDKGAQVIDDLLKGVPGALEKELGVGDDINRVLNDEASNALRSLLGGGSDAETPSGTADGKPE